MIPIPSGVRVWIATGHTDMRRGMNGLALQVQQALKRDPHAGDLFVFRGRRGNLVKVLWHDALTVGSDAASANVLPKEIFRSSWQSKTVSSSSV
jgi:transposase